MLIYQHYAKTLNACLSANIKFACGYQPLVSWMLLKYWNHHHQIVSGIF